MKKWKYRLSPSAIHLIPHHGCAYSVDRISFYRQERINHPLLILMCKMLRRKTMIQSASPSLKWKSTMIQYRTYPGAKTLDQFFMPFLKVRVALLWLENTAINDERKTKCSQTVWCIQQRAGA